MRLAAIVLGLAALTTLAAADDDYQGGTIIFARGAALYRTDPRGHGETEIATLGAKTPEMERAGERRGAGTVRALRTDAAGKILLADVGGTWSWMPLDGQAKSLTDLPCGDGPAQLAEDGLCVLCRTKPGAKHPSMIVNLVKGTLTPIDLPIEGARIAGTGADRKLVWADQDGVWTASPRDVKKTTKVAPTPPLRGFLPSPDGSRALGVYADTVYVDVHHTKPADVLMNFALDGEGAHRKSIKDGIPVEWSHDAQWALLQNGASACIAKASGGQYKCWKGYTAASISPDGRWALVLGNRDGSKKQPPPKSPKGGKGSKSGKGDKADKADKADKKKPEPEPEPAPEQNEDGAEHDASAPADVAVPPPTGPLSLFRTELDGPFTASPALVVKSIDGAAVWVPAAAAPAP